LEENLLAEERAFIPTPQLILFSYSVCIAFFPF